MHLTNTEYAWLGSAFSIAYLLAGPLAARWCDRLGARRAYTPAMLAIAGLVVLPFTAWAAWRVDPRS